jgi:type IV fimbrial biogenesis protein FimT
MVVVVVVAVLATLAAPSFKELFAKQRLRSTVSALNESLWLARSEATKRNVDVGFSFGDIGSGWSVKAGTTTLHVQDAYPGVSSAAGNFVFNAYGRLSSGAGKLQIAVSDADLYQCITVSTTGRATAEEKKCNP